MNAGNNINYAYGASAGKLELASNIFMAVALGFGATVAVVAGVHAAHQTESIHEAIAPAMELNDLTLACFEKKSDDLLTERMSRLIIGREVVSQNAEHICTKTEMSHLTDFSRSLQQEVAVKQEFAVDFSKGLIVANGGMTISGLFGNAAASARKRRYRTQDNARYFGIE